MDRLWNNAEFADVMVQIADSIESWGEKCVPHSHSSTSLGRAMTLGMSVCEELPEAIRWIKLNMSVDLAENFNQKYEDLVEAARAIDVKEKSGIEEPTEFFMERDLVEHLAKELAKDACRIAQKANPKTHTAGKKTLSKANKRAYESLQYAIVKVPSLDGVKDEAVYKWLEKICFLPMIGLMKITNCPHFEPGHDM